ncbi:MAG TPA: PEP-CTERM sorting domain-containing protein, partial [Phycisphaerales bacterium]|nr:PEP-CTERM sorting domain-containing protein [Phycisphaerales bacterium]
STRSPGDSVGEEWLWTNQYGGDQMDQGGTVARSQIISTSSGQDGATTFRFDGGNGTVDGPSGGMVSSPPQFAVPGNSRGVSDSLDFTLTLNGTMTEAQLAAMAGGSVVEYGSDARYLTVVPGPGSLALLGAGGLVAVRRRRR